MSLSRAVRGLSFLLVAFAAAGCSHITQPGTRTPDGYGEFAGSVEPTSGSFVLRTVTVETPGGIPVHVELIGRNLTVDPARKRVSLEVSVRNMDSFPLFAPAEIVVHDLNPFFVRLLDADWTACPYESTLADPTTPCTYGFDYSDRLGNDGVLEPRETSAPRTWRFLDPDGKGFSFGVTARFALEPSSSRIAGIVFWDGNENGRMDPGEGPFGGGAVYLNGPGEEMERRVSVGPDGRYTVPVHFPGHYSLRCEPPPTFAPVRPTTPNPLQVVLPARPDGRPESFLDANFGWANAAPPPGIPPVRFFDGPPDSLIQDPYHLLDIALEGYELHLRVGFSGCGPDHDFALYMVGGFLESYPVQARLVLSHDSFGELCDAYWERDLIYDLRPIMAAYEAAYGHPGTVVLRFADFGGNIHTFPIGPPTRDAPPAAP